MYCQKCNYEKNNKGLIVPDIKGKLLLLFDHPVEADLNLGKFGSGLSERNSNIDALLKKANLTRDKVSIGSVIQCITTNKSDFSIIEYGLCYNHIRDRLSSFNVILCFGDIPVKAVLNSKEKTRDLRNNTYSADGVSVRVTYSLSTLTGTGCCGDKALKQLMVKDLENAFDLSNRLENL